MFEFEFKQCEYQFHKLFIGGKTSNMAVKTKVKQTTHSEDIKERILDCAKTQFAKNGYHGANLKDIAVCAGVAGSLINYHFHNKEDLFKATIELFAKDRMEAINRLLSLPENREEMKVRIEIFVDEMLRSYTMDPSGFEIIHQEVKAQNPIVMKVFKETFLVAFKQVCLFFEKAQQKDLVDKKHDPFIISMLLFSATCDTAQNNHLGKQFFNLSLEDELWRKKVSQHIVDLFMMGVVK